MTPGGVRTTRSDGLPPARGVGLFDHSFELAHGSAQVASDRGGGDVLREPAGQPGAGDAAGETALDSRSATPSVPVAAIFHAGRDP